MKDHKRNGMAIREAGAPKCIRLQTDQKSPEIEVNRALDVYEESTNCTLNTEIVNSARR